MISIWPDLWTAGYRVGMPSLWEFVSRSVRNGCCFYVIVPRREGWGQSLNELAEQVGNIRVFYCTDYFSPMWNRFWLLRALRPFIMALEVLFIVALRVPKDFDVIYCLTTLTSFAGWLLRTVYQRKLVIRLFGLGMDGSRMEKNAVTFLRNFSIVMGFLCRANLYIITDDGSSGDRAAKLWGIDESRIRFMRNGISREFFPHVGHETARGQLALADSDVVALSVCRVESGKQVDRVVCAFAEAKHPRLRLVVVGDGEALSYVKQVARECGCFDRVDFVGAVPHDRIHIYYEAADMVLMAYEFSNIGNPFFEALSMGVPIICTSAGNPGRVLGNCGGVSPAIVLSQGDETNRMAEAIDYLAYNPHVRDMMSHSARKWESDHLLSWEDRINLEVTELERLVGEEN